MNGTLKTRYWDGHQPPNSYYEPINPYKAAQKCPFNLRDMLGNKERKLLN